MPQRFQGLSLENRQCRGRGTSSPDISECNAAELWQTGCRRDFSPACGADASLTRSWTHADACPCPFSADTARLAPSEHQRIERGTKPDVLGCKPCHWTRILKAAMVNASRAWKYVQTRCMTFLKWHTKVSIDKTVSTRMRSSHSPR